MEQKIYKQMALGQYIYWSRLQFDSFIYSANQNKTDEEILGRYVHWLSSLHVVIEGWDEQSCTDVRIDKILDTYKEYREILRKCRNAVYHYQKSQVDKRIKTALAQLEMKEWASILQNEFECYIYMYPFKNFGLCYETYELHEAFLASIGWIPNNHLIDMQDLYLLCVNYVYQNELNNLEKTKENDAKIAATWVEMEKIRDSEVESMLSRWHSNT